MRRRKLLRRIARATLAVALDARSCSPRRRLAAGLAEAAASAPQVPAAPQAPIQIKVTRANVGYGQHADRHRSAPSDLRRTAGQARFRAGGAPDWRPVGQATVGAATKFRLQAKLRQSGRVEVKRDAVPTPGSSGGSSHSPNRGQRPPRRRRPARDRRGGSFHLRHARQRRSWAAAQSPSGDAAAIATARPSRSAPERGQATTG